MAHRVVYFDERYPSSWTSEVDSQIARGLSSRGFDIKDADKLKTWMQNVISKNNTSKSVVVFAKDIIPDTVFEDFTPNVLIKRYLENGGRVIWIGDVPFWYRGKIAIGYHTDTDTTYQTAAYLGNLGVKFVHSIPAEPVKFTKEGKKMGLNNKWYGTRPVYTSRWSLANDFYFPKPTLNHRFIALGRSWNIVIKHFIEKSKGTRLAGFQLPFVGGGLTFEGADRKQLEYRRNLINSFKIIFNFDYTNQGFIRIWDYPIHEVTNEMLTELERIANNGLEQT